MFIRWKKCIRGSIICLKKCRQVLIIRLKRNGTNGRRLSKFAGNRGIACFKFAGNRWFYCFKFAGNRGKCGFEFAGNRGKCDFRTVAYFTIIDFPKVKDEKQKILALEINLLQSRKATQKRCINISCKKINQHWSAFFNC